MRNAGAVVTAPRRHYLGAYGVICGQRGAVGSTSDLACVTCKFCLGILSMRPKLPSLMASLAVPNATSEVAAEARLTGVRLADRLADVFDELAQRGKGYASFRYEEACRGYRDSFRREASLYPDPGFACLVQGFLAGADSAKPADTDEATWRSWVSSHGRILGHLFREWSFEGFRDQIEKRCRMFVERTQ